jgi:hypothetical protein
MHGETKYIADMLGIHANNSPPFLMSDGSPLSYCDAAKFGIKPLVVSELAFPSFAAVGGQKG